MTRWLAKATLLGAIAFPAFSGAAWGGGTDDFGCSNAMLKGEYAFGVIGYTPPGLPNGPPEVVTGIKVFDGRGNFTQRDYQGDNLATRLRAARAGNRHLSGQFGLYRQHGDQPEGPKRPPRHLPRGHRHHVCDQRRRPSYPRGR